MQAVRSRLVVFLVPLEVCSDYSVQVVWERQNGALDIGIDGLGNVFCGSEGWSTMVSRGSEVRSMGVAWEVEDHGGAF